jgi:hypothetical protein
MSGNVRQFSGVPNGIRTRVAAVKGRCPGPLDDGDVRPVAGGEPGRDRTYDQLVKSQLLYH